ncbi:MAG: hypothetical protein WBQ18_09825 [Solirubrobacteraceae bacterium]
MTARLRRLPLTATLAVATVGLITATAYAADSFAPGTFTGNTSQVTRFNGRPLHGTVTIASQVSADGKLRFVQIAPFFFTRCRANPTPMGFWTNQQVPYGFAVNGAGHFSAAFHYTVHVTDSNDRPVTGLIAAKLSGTFRTARLITGRFQATVRVHVRGRQTDTCTADVTYAATRHR